jgi:hypothetical protein
MISREFHSWIETANETNDTATATRAAPAGGLSHFVTSISGSFSATAAGVLLVLKQGTTEIGRWYVYDSLAVVFSSPVKIDAATAVNAELGAGGSTVVGAVTLTGYTA